MQTQRTKPHHATPATTTPYKSHKRTKAYLAHIHNNIMSFTTHRRDAALHSWYYVDDADTIHVCDYTRQYFVNSAALFVCLYSLTYQPLVPSSSYSYVLLYN